MTLSRRDFLKLSSLIAASTAIASCAPASQRITRALAPLENVAWPALSAADFVALSRLTFGPRPEERTRLGEIGLANWIEEQLAPESISDNAVSIRLRNIASLKMSASDLFDYSDGLFDNYNRQKVPRELRTATLIRQVYSRRQLHEVLVEFWNDHFNIFTEKGDCFVLKTVDDRDVIRAHALGSFRDLVWASAHSPAMLVYLDNQANTAGAPNENYARELMELHTLGVDAGYTQNDVMELARCLTGWSVKNNFWRGEFKFDAKTHDTGIKNILGLEIKNAGQADAETVIQRLVEHPAAAHFICAKLARRFLSDEVAGELIQKATQTFEQTHGDLRAVLRVILLDGLSLAGQKYKRPVNFVASSLRLLNAETDGERPVQDYLLQMGQTYFNWPTPDGYPDRAEPWQGNLMPRWQFAYALVTNEMKGTKVDLIKLAAAMGATSLTESVDNISALLLGTRLEESARDELIQSLRNEGATDEDVLPVFSAGILSSPAFQWR